jgi:predicted DCC family thiol-disulfide oxidoreductase YuxK
MSDLVALSPPQAPTTPEQRVASTRWTRAWRRLWFQDKSTSPLEIARMGIGAAMLLHFGLASPHLFTFWGDNGWVSGSLLQQQLHDPWVQSVFFYFTAPWQWIAFHALFLFCCAALMVGWRTSWVKWLVLIGHISYENRNPSMNYGVHAILACLLVILCFAPVGRAMCLDRVREVWKAKRNNLAADPPIFTSSWAFACTRLMQIQVALLFLFSGIHKIRGDDWWNGDAVWKVFVYDEYYNSFILDVLASQYWIVNVATYGTVLIEIAYPFLIWHRHSRPYMLAAAIFLHLQFAFLMHLYFFSFVMIMGHMSFVRRSWLRDLGAWWKRKIGAMEMIYDGHCGFCKRSMAWFLAFDGLRQISIRDFRTNPSPIVTHDQLLKALYLVLPDGRALPGFEAYRYVVLRVPGLWWQVPFFYIPVLSRLFGHPIYNWIAANRSRL